MAADRRDFLQSCLAAAASAALIAPDRALAGATPAGWALGVADVDADIAPQALHRLAGRAPADFAGTLFRNGPAKFRRGTSAAGHWFDGDGLVRRFRVGEGKAALAARFVDTPKRRLESELNAIVIPGFGTPSRPGAVVRNPDDTNAANTGVLPIGGELLALWEGGSAMRLDAASLSTLGFKTFRRDLRHMPFSAHPRIEPDGSVWNFGGNGRKTALWHIAPDGSLRSMTMVDLPRASYFHDFTLTAQHIIIVLQPWMQEGFSFPLAQTMKWRPEQGTQILVIAKDDVTQRRIYELPAFAAFHYGDGWEEADGTIRFDGCLEADPTFGQRAASALLRGEYIASPPPLLTQIILHPDGKAATLDTGVRAEFPVSDTRRAGQRRRLTAHVTGYRGTPFPHAIACWDWVRGRSDHFDFGDHQLVEEFQYVPGQSSDEADGWLIGCTLNLSARASELHLLRAGAVARGPVASWRADVALPIGFHGRFAAL
jgi:carotenoid cleavage dioxygenase-like enzyme